MMIIRPAVAVAVVVAVQPFGGILVSAAHGSITNTSTAGKEKYVSTVQAVISMALLLAQSVAKSVEPRHDRL